MTTNKISDEWRTPGWLVDKLRKEFIFTHDLCCRNTNENNDFGSDNNSIGGSIHAVFDLFGMTDDDWVWSSANEPMNLSKRDFACFMNPPYSNPKPFIEKALDLHHRFNKTVVMLLKVDTSTKWWALLWDYERHKPKLGVEVRFLPKRVKFDAPIGWEGKVTTPAFPSCIVILRATYQTSDQRREKRKEVKRERSMTAITIYYDDGSIDITSFGSAYEPGGYGGPDRSNDGTGIIHRILPKQEDLSPEMKEILEKNIWDLYEK